MNFGSHPANLALRFILEMTVLFVAAYSGWVLFGGWMRIALATGFPLLLALVWGIFAVPGDPSRSGKTLVKTPGILRLIIELGIFTYGTLTLLQLGYQFASIGFAVCVVLHYLLSADRIRWLLEH